MPLYDPLDDLAPTKAPAGKKMDAFDFFPSAEEVAAHRAVEKAAAESAPDPTEGMSFGDKVAAGAGKRLYDLGSGTTAWGLRTAAMLPGSGDTEKQAVRDFVAKDAERRHLDAPLMGTLGGKLGSSLPDVAVSALVPPAGLPSYITNAGLSFLGETDPMAALSGAALSLPGTAMGNTAAALGARSLNALPFGKNDPTKANIIAADQTLRQTDPRGLPVTAFVKPSSRMADFDRLVTGNGTSQNVLVDMLTRMREAADAKNTALWKQVDEVARNNKAIISIDPTQTLGALNNFRRQYGTQHLVDLSNPRDAAALLHLMGNDTDASRVLSKTLTDAERGNPQVVSDFFTNVDRVRSGASFEQMRNLQQQIGSAIGELSGKKDVDRQMLGALRGAYSSVLGDMESTGNRTVDKQLTEALRAASKQHREEVLPFRTGEVSGGRNPILANFANGKYTSDPAALVADMSTPSGRAAFQTYLYPRLTPEEAATAQKIWAEPKLAGAYRRNEVAYGENPIVHPLQTAAKTMADLDAVRYNRAVKAWMAANPTLLENTQFRPVSRAVIGGLRQMGNAASPAVVSEAPELAAKLNPLSWFRGDRESQVPYVSVDRP